MTAFENKLKMLFEAQAFFRDPKLDAILEHGSARTLSDDELELLFAAGDPFTEKEKMDDA